MVLMFPATGKPESTMLESSVNRHASALHPCRLVGIGADHSLDIVPSTSGVVGQAQHFLLLSA